MEREEKEGRRIYNKIRLGIVNMSRGAGWSIYFSLQGESIGLISQRVLSFSPRSADSNSEQIAVGRRDFGSIKLSGHNQSNILLFRVNVCDGMHVLRQDRLTIKACWASQIIISSQDNRAFSINMRRVSFSLQSRDHVPRSIMCSMLSDVINWFIFAYYYSHTTTTSEVSLVFFPIPSTCN